MATVDKYLKVRKGVDTPDVLTSSATVYDYLKTPLVYFDTTASATPTIGGMVWDDGEGTLSFGLKGGEVNLQIGQENVALCYNGTGSAITNGQVVYITGAQGQKPSISLASAISEEGSSKVFGVTTENIASGGEGFVATFGIVGGINTSGFTEGAALWLSASPGKFTETKPLSPAHLVFVGYCLKVNMSSGRIFVNPQNGYELEELHDVLIQTASQTHVISYNSASGLWMNKDLQAAIKEVDGAGSGIDADLLDGQQGSYYLDWTNTTNKPDPIIGVNLTGNTIAAASVTLTDLTNGQISLTTNTNFATSASSINWIGVTNKPDPIIGINLTGNTTGAASATLTDLASGQISITTNTAHSLTASSIAGSLVTGTVANATNAIHANTASSISGLLVQGPVASANFALLANSASSINWTGVTGTPTTILGYGITDGLRASDAASAYIRVTSSAAIVSGYIPVTASQTYLTRSDAQIFYVPISASSAIVSGYIPISASQAYLTRTDAQIVYIPISASSSIVANYVPVSASSAIVSNYIPVSSSQAYLTRIDATNTYLPLSGSISWGNISNKPDPIIAVNLSGNTTGAASATLTDLTNGQISITTNTAFASTASSINWAGVTGRPTTLSGYGITDAIPASASQAYLTRSDAVIIYAPLASASLTGTPIAPTAASGTNTQQIATTAFVRTEVSNLIASAPATLDTLNELAAALGNDPNFATSTASAIGQRLLASTASTLYMSIGSTANHATSASSINWNGVTNRPDPIIGVSLSGNTSGAASVTLTDLNNGQISITTNTAHANTASSIAGALVTGTVTNATNATTLTTARNIGDVSFNGSANIVPQRIFFKDTRSDNYNPLSYPGVTLHLKSNTTDGLTDGGTYHGILDLTHWNDLSGGVVHQLGLTDNGNMFIRYSTSSSTWSSWDQFAKLSSGRVLLSASSTISQLSLHANTASSIAGSLVTGIVNNALHSNTASSIAGSLVTGTVANATNASHSSTASSINASLLTGTTLPAAIINSSLTSVGTLTNLSVTNVISGRSASANFSVHSLTASSISGTLVTGTVNNANHTNTASSINSSLITGTTLPAAIVNSSLTNVGTLGSLTVSGNLTVDTDTLFIDSINNRVGIRTTSPSATLHVNATSTTAPSLTWGANSGQILRNENSELAIGLSNSNPFPLYFQGRTNTNTSRQIVLQPLGGNVGIGGDPSRTFTVVGTASFTGDISAPTHSGLLLGNAMTASSIAGSLVTGTVNNANQANTASSINISGVTGLASNISTFLQTPTSANLASAVTDESGTAGAVAFTNNPTFTGTLNAQTIDATGGILVEAYTKDNINLRTDGGFFQTSIATTASGWPQTTNSWYHLISSTHSNTGNYYSMQFAGSFFDSNALFYRATNGSGTTSWNQLWHSGNISAASVSWGNISSKPSPIIGVNLTGAVTGAASATLNQLTNGQISITTATSGGGTGDLEIMVIMGGFY